MWWSRVTMASDLPRALGLHAVAADLRSTRASMSETPFTAASGTAAAKRPVVKSFCARLALPITFLARASLRHLFP